MRKLLGAVLVALLIPAALAAQKPATKGEDVGWKVPVFITADQARTAALARVKPDLAAGTLKAWGTEGGGSIRPTTLQARANQVDDIYKSNEQVDDIYKNVIVVAVTSPNAKGHVRVVVNKQTGAVLSAKLSSWDWGNSPDWWVRGLNSPPPAKTR